MKWYFIENCVIYICTAFMVVWLFSMSDSFHSLWAMLMLIFVNFRSSANTEYPSDKE